MEPKPMGRLKAGALWLVFAVLVILGWISAAITIPVSKLLGRKIEWEPRG